MATVKYGSLVTSLRGKLGGHVYQKCNNVEGVRTAKAKTFIKTDRLENQRNIMRRISNYWDILTESQKNEIAQVASTYPAYDKHGNQITPNAYQVFVMINMLMIRNPYGMIVPVNPFAPPEPVAAEATTWDVQSNECHLDIQGTPTEQTFVYLYLAKPQRSRTGLAGAHYRYAGYIPVSQVETENIHNKIMLAIFGLGNLPQQGAYNNWYIPFYLKFVIPFTGSWRDTGYNTIYIYNP